MSDGPPPEDADRHYGLSLVSVSAIPAKVLDRAREIVDTLVTSVDIMPRLRPEDVRRLEESIVVLYYQQFVPMYL